MNQITSEQLFRRKFPRRKFRRVVGFLYRGDYSLGAGVEIGEGGIAFLGTPGMEHGNWVVLSLQIPRGPFISVRAQIKNIAKGEGGMALYGCSFENLKFEGRREIRTFVTARSVDE